MAHELINFGLSLVRFRFFSDDFFFSGVVILFLQLFCVVPIWDTFPALGQMSRSGTPVPERDVSQIGYYTLYIFFLVRGNNKRKLEQRWQRALYFFSSFWLFFRVFVCTLLLVCAMFFEKKISLRISFFYLTSFSGDFFVLSEPSFRRFVLSDPVLTRFRRSSKLTYPTRRS